MTKNKIKVLNLLNLSEGNAQS